MSALVGHAGVDEAARAVTFVFRRNADIEGTAGAAADDFDGLFGITPCRHRPQDIKLAGGIDIIIDHHHEASVVRASENLRCEKESLPRVTGIGLFNRNHVEEAADAGFEGPDSFDVRQSALFDAVPYLRGANHSLGERIIRWRPARPRDAQDRIVAIIDAFDPKHRSVFHPGAVVAEPFSEWSIRLERLPDEEIPRWQSPRGREKAGR